MFIFVLNRMFLLQHIGSINCVIRILYNCLNDFYIVDAPKYHDLEVVSQTNLLNTYALYTFPSLLFIT